MLFVVTNTSARSHLKFQPDEAAPPGEAADFSESDLLTRMSHEMRTPLSAILGFAQLMESCKPSPTISQKRRIDLILQAGWQLEKLINMTRDLALLQSGALTLSLDPVPLAAVMLDVEAMIEPQAQVRGIRVTFPLLDDTCLVLADAIRLQQVLDHLLSAAIECSEVDGAVVVDCDTRGSDCIRILINDADEESAGRGIGLLLAKRLIELMGGAIGVENVVGTGRIFSFDLKRMLVPAAFPAARRS
jgi:signal transduction histidine kinase